MDIVESYLVQLQEIEIISGMVPVQLFKLGNKEVWLFNFEVGKFIRRKLLKRAMYLQIDDPKELRKKNGSSTASVRQYDLHIRHGDPGRVIDKGEAHIKYRMNPLKVGWFSTGAVFDLFDFRGMKTLKQDDYFRLRVQRSRQQQGSGGGVPEPTLDAEIVRFEDPEVIRGM